MNRTFMVQPPVPTPTNSPAPPADDAAARETWLADDGLAALADARAALALLPAEDWSVDVIDAALRGVVETRGCKPRDVFQPIRVALAGTATSPGIFETLAVLGRAEALRRLDAALGSA